MHRKESEQKSVESEESLRSFFENSFDAMMLISPDGAVYSANPEACRVFGMPEEEIRSSGWEDLMDNAAPRLQEALSERSFSELFRGELTLKRKDGVEFPAELSMAMFMDREGTEKASLIIRDISEQKRLETERLQMRLRLQEMQRLESLSILAGGVAHDFNNVLQPIVGYAQLARRKTDADPALADYLTKIEHAAERATQLAYRMLAYSGKWNFHFETVALSLLMKNIHFLLASIVPAPVKLRCFLASGLPSIEADHNQLSHVAKALVSNAVEAIGDNSGTITIRTGLMTAERSYLDGSVLGEGVPPGDLVFLEVADSGCGMTPDIAAKVFDPFFSTKFTGRGLSLASVLGIMRGHQGAIRVESRPGEGATFRLLFPLIADAEQRHRAERIQ